MTKEACIEKVEEMIDRIPERMKKNLCKLLASGAVDYESAEDNYLLPKKIMNALIMEEQFQHKPLHDDRKTKREIESYYACI